MTPQISELFYCYIYILNTVEPLFERNFYLNAIFMNSSFLAIVTANSLWMGKREEWMVEFYGAISLYSYIEIRDIQTNILLNRSYLYNLVYTGGVCFRLFWYSINRTKNRTPLWRKSWIIERHDSQTEVLRYFLDQTPSYKLTIWNSQSTTLQKKLRSSASGDLCHSVRRKDAWKTRFDRARPEKLAGWGMRFDWKSFR